MTFRETVYKCILLAFRAEIEYVRRHPEEVVSLADMAKDLPESLKEIPKNEKELLGFLNSLPEPVLMKLQTFMYWGREREDLKDLHAHLARETSGKEDAIRTIRKIPLAEYLVQALLLAEKNKLDIESAF